VTNWVSPDNYVHACYTDITALFFERNLDTNTFAYQSATASFEYPPIIGVGNWLLSFLTTGSNAIDSFFTINVILIVIFFLISALLVRAINPKFSYLFPVAPAVGASLFINWDLWVVVPMILAIYYFDKGKFEVSSIWLGIAISTKFFPIILLIPIAIIFYRRDLITQCYRYLINTTLIWSAFNIPIAIFYFDGWWRFFKLNIERGADFGSIWYSLSLLNLEAPYLNLLSTLLTISAFAYLIIYLINLPITPTLAQTSFFSVVALTTFAKVYSPQYVLWLTPLAVIAIKSKPTLVMFWIWQMAELIYHAAIWQHLATISEAQFGLSQNFYGAISLIRLAASIAMIYSLARQLRQARSTQGKPWDFLFESASTYP